MDQTQSAHTVTNPEVLEVHLRKTVKKNSWENLRKLRYITEKTQSRVN